jgi:hypothetical protein
VGWTSDLYPTSLPYTSSSSFYAALCDIGLGASYIRSGDYVILWDGTGKVDASGPNVQSYTTTSSKSARVHFNVIPSSTTGITVRILQSQAQDPVHNVRLIPLTFASNYTEQIFQPDFLKIIKPYDLIRFTGWKRNLKDMVWAARTKSTSQTQHLSAGVAIEHMIDLVRVTKKKYVWFSFPVNSVDYNQQMITLLANNLPNGTTIYYETGSPETHGDTNRYSEFVTLSNQMDSTFHIVNKTRPGVIFHLIPTACVVNTAYVPYLLGWYGVAGMKKLQAVGMPGQFGRSPFGWDRYDSYGSWDISYGTWSVDALINEVRRSTLTAEVMQNTMLKRLVGKNPHLSIVAYTSGPMFAPNSYGYRAGRASVLGCATRNAFPCTWANTHYNFPDQASLDAARQDMDYNCTLEETLEKNLISIQRDDAIYPIYLDYLRRWEAIGGKLTISAGLVQPALTCPTGGKGCGNPGLFESPFFDDCIVCGKYRALIDYSNGVRSTLPFTSADLPLVPALNCTPGCQYGTCVKNQCVCYAGYTGHSCNVVTHKYSDCNNAVGINLAGIADWSSEWSHVDLMKTARDWISQDYTTNAWSTNSIQSINKFGYPNSLGWDQKLGTTMIRDLRGHIRNGTYVCLYDGDGILTFSMDIMNVSRDVGRIEVSVSPSTGLNNGVFLLIERTNPLNPVRNIRFFMPGFENSPIPFHPLFLDSIKKYKVIRFMDWMRTNNVIISQWNEDNTLQSRTYSMNNGVPLEEILLLCNMVGADPWFNMPHLATNDFIDQFARTVKSNLRPDLKIYIEYSNEVWGTLFAGGIYAQQQGLLEGLSTDATKARLCYYAKRSSEIFTIWKNVFGTSSFSRLKFVYSSQSVQSTVSKIILECSHKLKVSTNATHLAVAPYFGTYSPSTDTNFTHFLTVTLPSQISVIESTMLEHYQLAHTYNLSFITYESGIGLQGSGKSTDFALLANRHPYMKQLYLQYARMLSRSHVNLIMQFTSAALYDYNQAWGLKEASDQDPNQSPKYLGLMQYIAERNTCPNSVHIDDNSDPSLCSYSGIWDAVNQRCECYYGASGKNCENTKYTEHTDLCGYYCTFNQGKCVLDYVVGADRYWKCECHPHYYGYQCSLFNCSNSCNYNGICLDIDVCSCYPGYTGRYCEIDCGCNGHGSCSSDAGDSRKCNCDLGWEWSIASQSCVPSCLKNDASSKCVKPGVSNTCESSCQYGFCVNGECICYAGVEGADCSIFVPEKRLNYNSSVGTNLGGISYYTSQWSFVDVMKISSDWVSLGYPGYSNDGFVWGNGQPIHLRPDGYPAYLLPGQMLGKLMLRDVRFHAPAGKYICLYDGDGVIDFSFDAHLISRSKNRVEFMFQPTYLVGCTAAYCTDNGVLLKILETNVNDPIRNIRVIMPGFESLYESMPFHPFFLKNIQYYSTLRFMDWQRTNSNTEIYWSDRNLPSNASQSVGVSLEHMIELSNLIGANPWFCIPHKASDDYIRRMAAMIRDRLRPDVDIYIEYSNEVWNGLFSQATYATEQGKLRGLSSDQYLARYRFYSERSVEIFTIFKSVFINSKTKVHYVLSSWTISTSATKEIISWKNAYLHATVVGVAPYFDCGGLGSPQNAAHTALLTVSEVIDICNRTMHSSIQPILVNMKKMISHYNLSYITYEAGQSLVETNIISYGNGETAGLTNLFIAVNRDPRMYDLYKLYIDVLNSVNLIDENRPLMHFSSCGIPTKYGSWGVIEYSGQPVSDTPKYRALVDILTSYSKIKTGEIRSLYSKSFVLNYGKSLESYTGYPVLISPRRMDRWISENNYFIQWMKEGISESARGKIILHKVSSLSPSNETEVYVFSDNVVLSQGYYKVTIPSATQIVFDGDDSYYLEIRGNSGSNFSETFSIQTQYFLNNTKFICCEGTTKPEFNQCLRSSHREYSYRLFNESHSKYTLAHLGGVACTSPYPYWPATGTYDIYGCRQYYTARESGLYGLSKPVKDCVSQNSSYPKLSSGEVLWDESKHNSATLETSFAKCESEMSLEKYSPQPNTCDIFLGVGNPSCADWTFTPSFAPTFSPSLLYPRPTFFTRFPTSPPLTLSPSSRPPFHPTPPPSSVGSLKKALGQNRLGNTLWCV